MEMLVLEERGKAEYPEKSLLKQQGRHSMKMEIYAKLKFA